MISKVEMAKELADVEVELALRQQDDAREVVQKLRERLIKDISKGTKGANPNTTISGVIYEILSNYNHKIISEKATV